MKARVLLLLWLLLGGLAMAAETTVYVRNAAVPRPYTWSGSEIYVPAATLLSLLRGYVGNLSVDGSGAVVVDGAVTTLRPMGHGREMWYPLLGIARERGFEVIAQPALGIIDVASPKKQRLQEVARADAPIDPREEAIAKRGARQVEDIYDGLCDDVHLIKRVEHIGQRIGLHSGRPNLHWQFFVVNSPLVNAISVGGGRVFVTKGLLEFMDDDELAGVIAHEIAHNCMRHSERAGDAVNQGNYYLEQAAQARARGDLAAERDFLEKAHQVVDRLQNWTSGERWDEEKEADRMGMLYAHNAGFNPLAMVHALERLQQVPSKVPTAVMLVKGASDHPPLPERIELAKKVYDSYFRR